MKHSVMTAGAIYEEVNKMRTEIKEIDEALDAIELKLGTSHIAYTLLNKQRSDKFNMLQEFEKTAFYQQTFNQPFITNTSKDTSWADTPASKPF